MRHDIHRSQRAQLVGMLLLTAVVFVAFWVGQSLEEALPPLLALLVLTALLELARTRSQTVEVMGGIGDERTRSLYTRAGALTSSILSFALPVWWLGTVAAGEPNHTLGGVCALFGVTFVVSSLIAARRGG